MTIDYWYELYKSYVEICVFLLSVLKQQQQITPQKLYLYDCDDSRKKLFSFSNIL